MAQEVSDNRDAINARFQDEVFLHSVAGNRPDLWHQLFNQEETEEGHIEWIVPRSEDEMRQLMEIMSEVSDASVRTDLG